jgi:preprotein translocase subunit SecG
MITFLTVLHIFVCLFLILVVLLQAGKGGGMGIAFGGSGGSQTVFGSSGAGNFLTRLTTITATIFLITSLGLAHFSSQQDSKRLQRLAQIKDADKKVEEVRLNKLKQDLEKARATQSSPPAATTTTPPPGASAPAAPATTAPAVPATAPNAPGTPSEKGAEGVGKKPGKKPAATAASATGQPAETDADGKPVAPPPRKKRAPKTDDAAGKPDDAAKTEAAPHAPPVAPAPAQ